MQGSHEVRDPSTVAALAPGMAMEIHTPHYKSSMRVSGSHYMTLRRPSRLPEAGREYVPGDPVRMIDWKAYARTDQLIVREVRDEASARVIVGLDLSETMQWPTPEITGIPKSETATRLALHLSYSHLRMGDYVELWLFDDGNVPAPRHVLKPRSPSDLMAAFEHLRAAGFHPAAVRTEFEPGVMSSRIADVAYFAGDGLGKADYETFLTGARRGMMLQVLSARETDIAWIDGDTSYFDEGAGRKEYQGQVLRYRDNYLHHLKRWLGKTAKRLSRNGIEHYQVTEQTRVNQYLLVMESFLSRRLEV